MALESVTLRYSCHVFVISGEGDHDLRRDDGIVGFDIIE
jgi:hypothetical protein